MKGIILAGGSGSRLYPLTLVTSKQLLPIYDKPMIYYPLSTLMLAGIRDILLISTKEDAPRFEKLLKDGKHLGINITYKVQEKPEGIAQAFLIAEDFIGDDSVTLILGDNIYYGSGFRNILREAVKLNNGGTIFAYHVTDPERFGVVEFDNEKKAISIEEKPKNPKSNYAVTGLYIYNNNVIDYAKKIRPSDRGELEITSINEEYLKNENLDVKLLGRGFTWIDTGTHESLVGATNFVKTIEEHQGIKISVPEEIGYINGWLHKTAIIEQANKYHKTSYGKYLLSVAEGKVFY